MPNGTGRTARAVYREIKARSTTEYVQPSMLALAAAALGEIDEAIEGIRFWGH
jgi:hypothetical protein